MNRIPSLLSKTKLMRGYRCMKSIYLTIHHPKLEAPITPALQALFDQGNEVGEMARTFYPGGVLIDNVPWDFGGAIAKTKHLIAEGATLIYEAAFEYMGCYARADIIRYSSEVKRWQIIEVKSSTKVKPEQIDDVGLQAWIMAKSGLPIESIHIMHLNSACRHPDLSNLFITEDVTDAIRQNYLSIKPKIKEIFDTIRQPDIPPIDIGAHCHAPTECGFIDYCWKQKKLPEISIFNLPGIWDRKWNLYQAGIIELNDERLTDLTELQQRVIDVHYSKQRYINREAIRHEMTTWQFPLVFLDFETINPAIPRYEGTGPFQQVAFQFSVHRWETPEQAITHIDFLHTDTNDPRPTLIPALLNACGDQGSIVAYFGQFEGSRIKEMAEFAPQYAKQLHALVERIVDPLPIIKEHVYDDQFMGSFSLKKVAPALLGAEHSYADMAVGDGSAAQRAFEELISEKTSTPRKAELKQAMLEYCKKDTWVMVELTKWLYSV